MSPELIAITLLGLMLVVETVATVLGLWGDRAGARTDQ